MICAAVLPPFAIFMLTSLMPLTSPIELMVPGIMLVIIVSSQVLVAEVVGFAVLVFSNSFLHLGASERFELPRGLERRASSAGK